MPVLKTAKTATSGLNDSQVRSFLIERISQTNQHADAVLIEELDLCLGEARVDLVLVNGKTVGIEIKSDRDNLDRLPKQIEIYSRVFDQVEIVSGVNHLDQIFQSVPNWWGVPTVTGSRQWKLEYRRFRSCKVNLNKDPLSAAQLLWKKEVLELLMRKQLTTKYNNKTRDVLWATLVETFPKTDIFRHVNYCLKKRTNWRFVHRLTSGDGLYQL